MHNNKGYFKDTKCEAGFFKIYVPDTSADTQQQAGTAAPAAQPPSFSQQLLTSASTTATAVQDLVAADKARDPAVYHNTLHDMSDKDMYALAAYVATLLLKLRMIEEGALPAPAAGMAVSNWLGLSMKDSGGRKTDTVRRLCK